MAIIEKIITLTDGTEFKFKYDDTPIETTGDNAYISENAKSNLYCAYQLDNLNKVIPAHESTSKITTSSFNGYPENGFLFDNASLTWNINYDHYETKAFFANTVFLWYDNNIPYIVTEIDTSRLLYKPTVTHPTEYYKLPLSTSLSENSCVILSADKTQQLNTINICPFTIINNSNKLYTFFTFQDVSNTINNTKSNSLESSYSNGFVHNRSACINSEYTGELYFALPENAEFVVGKSNGKTQAFPVNNDIDLYIKAGGNPSYKSARACNRLKTEHIVKYCLAGRGLAFLYNDTVIYPVINGGIVTGYTENINDSGEYKDWQGIHDHDVPTDPSGGDDIDDITLTMSTVSNAAFRKLFALNATELNQLEAALSGNYLEPLPSGFDPLQSVISLSVFPWDITNINWIGCNTTANAQITISGWDSGVTGSYVTGATSAFIEVGSFNVEHRHNNFLDYAPYTTVSVYVPYCGEIELPTNLVMGQSVRVFLIYDIPSGSCRAVIKSSNGSILGTIAGDFSSGIEITSSEAGLKKQSIISATLNTTGQVVGTAIGVVKEDISAATGGIVGSLGAVSQSIASMNKNYTSSVGATDGMINFFMPDQCYIKITRPKVSIPSNYGHTTGYACNKTMKLGDLTPGNYYVANNPDLSDSLGNEEEKAMLKAALENGFFK